MEKIVEILIQIVEKFKLDQLAKGFIVAYFAYGKGQQDTITKAQEVLNEKIKKHKQGVVNMRRDPDISKFLHDYFRSK